MKLTALFFFRKKFQETIIKTCLPARQAKRIMKLIPVFLLATCLQVSATGFSQRVTLSMKDAPLQKVFKEINRQTGLQFFYKDALLKQVGKVDIDVKNVPVEDVLKQCFENYPVTYSLVDESIVIKEKTDIQNTTSDQPPSTITIHGRVINETGAPVAGASVKIKGTKIGSTTNENGDFQLENVDQNATLVITGTNIETTSINVSGRTTFEIKVKIKVSALDQVQVIGYGTTTKRLTTGSSSSITSKDLESQPIENPLVGLQGRIAGATITQASGLPGSNVKIVVRGVNTIDNSHGTAPLYIVDGVPFNIVNQSPANGTINALSGSGPLFSGLSPFSVIDPSEIESIVVLKDADATSIYGTRGANGVILITTKKGKAGKTKLGVTVYHGAGKVARFVDMMNTSQYLQMRKEAYANDGQTPGTADAPDLTVWDPNKNTDWQKKYLGGTAKIDDAELNLSGGDARTTFLFNGGYHRETTIFPGSFNDTRLSGRFTSTHNSIDKRLNIFFTTAYSNDQSVMPQADLSTAVISLAPNMPDPLNSDGSYNWNTLFNNPESMLKQIFLSKTSTLITNLTPRYTILPGLDVLANIGFTKTNSDQNGQTPATTVNPLNNTPTNTATFGGNQQETYNIEPQINYARKIGNGHLTTLLGSTFSQSLNTGFSAEGDNYSNPQLLGVIAAAGNYQGNLSNSYTKYRYNSLYARAGYNWMSKYILNLTFRRDGSSKFGPGNRIGNFGAVGAAWIFTNEKFMRNVSFISSGKLRGSYGTSGSDQIPDYLYGQILSGQGRYSYQGAVPLALVNANNPDLHWELNKKLDFGLDLGFIHDRILLTADYYRNRSSNQLGAITIGSQSGFTHYYANFNGLIENSGFELELSSINVRNKDVTWTTSFNLTVPKTLLVKVDPTYFLAAYNIIKAGSAQSIVIGPHYLGTDPATGQSQYADSSSTQNPVFYPNSQTNTPIGQLAPVYYGGITNNIRYKSIELGFVFQYVKQAGRIAAQSSPGTPGNLSTFYLNRWQKPGDVNVLPKASLSDAGDYYDFGLSSATWGNKSYISFNNLSLSYTLPNEVLRKSKISSLKFFLQGQNLFTWTMAKYVNAPGNNTIPNQSLYSTAPLRIISAGFKIEL